MIRRLFWLSAIAGVGYMLWRWVRQQSDQPAPSAERLYAPPEAAPARPAHLGAEGEPSSGPRRIPTRIHRGAPPAATPRAEGPEAAAPPAPEQPAAPEGDLAGLVGEAAAAEGDLAELVGDAVAGEAAVDLTPLVSPEAAAGAPALGGAPTNLNTADEAALVALPGIGPALARRIIAYRDEHGPFSSVEQLEAIQGIGPRNIEEFRHLVTV